MDLAVEEILGTAPLGSFAQIVVCANESPDAAWAAECDTASAAAAAAKGGDGARARATLSDAAACAGEVDAMKAAIAKNRVPVDDLRGALLVQRLVPRRVELLRNVAGGTIWDRFEWVNEAFEDGGGGGDGTAPLERWSAPRRLVPY